MKHRLKRLFKWLVLGWFFEDDPPEPRKPVVHPVHPADTGNWERTNMPGLRPQDRYSIN